MLKKNPGRIAAGVSLFLALLAAGSLLLAPCAVRGSRSSTTIPNGPSTHQDTCSSLIEATSGGVILAVLTPAALAGLAIILSGTRLRAGVWICAAVVLAFSILTGFSVGLFFLPAAIALLVAGSLQSAYVRPVSPHQDATPG